MVATIPEEQLREDVDRITREVTHSAAGIELRRCAASPETNLYSVYIRFQKGFQFGFSLRADALMLTRLTRAILCAQTVSPQDVEDVAKEYFNVLCGHFAHAFYRTTQVASRFDVPAFYQGTFRPQGLRERFCLNYAAGTGGLAQLIYHVPE